MSSEPATTLVLIVTAIMTFMAFGKGGSGGEEKFRDYDYNRDRNRKISEIDRLLDKVSVHGVQSLSESERKKLDQISKEMGGGS